MQHLLKPYSYWVLRDSSPIFLGEPEDYQGNTEFYSFDVFRRLYNDAVESMQFYKQLAEGYCNAADMYRAQCENLENHLIEYVQESCDD